MAACAAGAVQEALEQKKHWAYTTVKTLMDRMVKKGLLHTDRIRNLYRAAITPAQAKRSEIMRTLKRAFNSSLTPMMQLLIDTEEISEEEYHQLVRLIESKKGRRAKVTDEQIEIIFKLKQEGMKIAKIARAVSLSRLTIYRVLQRYESEAS